MRLIYKSDKIVFGIILGGVGSLLSGAYIIDQLNARNDKIYTLNESKTILSIVFWPLTLPYALCNDKDIINFYKSVNLKV